LPAILFVLIVLGWSIKVYDIGDILELRLHGVTSLKHNHDVELPYVEEMNKTLELILRHFRVQYEASHVKSIEEKLYSVCLDHIVGIYQHLWGG
jgi:hypothetical protein